MVILVASSLLHFTRYTMRRSPLCLFFSSYYSSYLLAFSPKEHCRLTFNLTLIRAPGAFSVKLLSSQSAPSTYLCLRTFLPKCRSLYFFFFELWEVRPNPLSSPSWRQAWYLLSSSLQKLSLTMIFWRWLRVAPQWHRLAPSALLGVSLQALWTSVFSIVSICSNLP